MTVMLYETVKLKNTYLEKKAPKKLRLPVFAFFLGGALTIIISSKFH